MGFGRPRGVGAVAACLLLALAGCTSGSGPGAASAGSDTSSGGSAGGSSPSWATKPVTARGLTSVATSHADGFALHTASGAKTFVPGVNLGSTTPLHQPGELAITAQDYRRWFAEMGRLGVRAVRIYTIHPPAFYDELAAYDRAHPEAPIYLVQGVYLPDESYVGPGRTLYDAAVDTGFTHELRDASAAVHGDLTRPPTPGHASGTWHTDVSGWLMAWIVGVEWDPSGVRRTDRREAEAPYSPGRYVRATAGATATERWIARHLETLAGAEAARGSSDPLAFVNWPTTDPLRHPDEPLPQEDLVGVDAEHVRTTAAWPGGTFASFHAYPYYPDFLRHEKALARTTWRARPDPYAGYLAALRAHFTTMPVLVTETGVPSSLGSAHRGIDGRDQGGHTEQQAMAIDADLLRVARAEGMGAGLVFAWADEWFKRTWNTEEHQMPGADRRQLWHDPLTNEQWFGIVATDSARLPDAAHDARPSSGPVASVHADADASYVHLDVTARDRVPGRLVVGVDTVPGSAPGDPSGEDYRIVVDLHQKTATASVRAALDPVRLDTEAPRYQPDVGKPWHLYRLIVNRALSVRGHRFPPELQDVGRLVEGDWNPAARRYDSLATWQVAGRTIRLRVPWPMLGLADPSSRLALGEGTPAAGVRIPGLGLTFSADGAAASLHYTWPTWNYIRHTERVKAGADALRAAFRDTARG